MKKKKHDEGATLSPYPTLAKRQKDSTVIERRVRRLLNRQTPEDDENARQLLATIRPDKRGAEYYFLSGCLRHRLGHLTDALAYLDRACELSKNKCSEYTKLRDTVRAAAAPTTEALEHFAVIDPEGQPHSRGRTFVFWNFMGECCTEGCCECCIEGCCEGCADGCSCDC